jgi:hypothetical protein
MELMFRIRKNIGIQENGILISISAGLEGQGKCCHFLEIGDTSGGIGLILFVQIFTESL